MFFMQAQLPDFLGRPPPHTGTTKGGSLTADQLRTLVSVIFPIAVCTLDYMCSLGFTSVFNKVPIIWDTIDQESADQRALEEYRRQKAEHAKLVEERAQLKKAHGSYAMSLPPLPAPPRAPRRPRKGKQKQMTRADSPLLYPIDQHMLHEDEDDSEALIHTSFRRDDASSAIDLALAVQDLTRRIITLEQQEAGRFYLKRYLAVLSKVRKLC
jgi:hypothetical protein